MLTDIFANRYLDVVLWKAFDEPARRLLVHAAKYGDTIGPLAFPGQSSPPENAANFQDIFAAVAGFQQINQTASVIWLDLTPELPDGFANFADIFGAVVGFQTGGTGYPFAADPCSCPGACP